jgi:hypothetical protein
MSAPKKAKRRAKTSADEDQLVDCGEVISHFFETGTHLQEGSTESRLVEVMSVGNEIKPVWVSKMPRWVARSTH